MIINGIMIHTTVKNNEINDENDENQKQNSLFSRPSRMAGWLWNLRPRRKPTDSDTAGAAHQGHHHLLPGRRGSSPRHMPVGPPVSPDTIASGGVRRTRHKRSLGAERIPLAARRGERPGEAADAALDPLALGRTPSHRADPTTRLPG